MPRQQRNQNITNIDIVTLEHFAEAQLKQKPTPPAFNDTLMRLSKNGFIRSDQNREFMVTPKGRNFLGELNSRCS
jgi:DNA-binding PadR family transcriptional regulator